MFDTQTELSEPLKRNALDCCEAGSNRRDGSLIPLRNCEPSQLDVRSGYRRERYRRRHVAQMRDLRASRKAAGLDPNGSEGYAKPSRRFWCGKARAVGSVSVKVRQTESGPHAHFSGAQHCGSVWACPVCAPIIRRERADEVAEGMGRHVAAGGGAVFATFTVRHTASDSLADVKRTLSDAYAGMARSRAFREWKDAEGFAGSITATEVTYGANGWHVHRHIVYLFEHAVSDAEALAMGDELFGMWSHEVERAGGRTVSREAFDVRAIGRGTEDVARYVTKVSAGIEGLGREVALSDVKRGRVAGSVAPFQLLDVETPEAEALWFEYVTAMKGTASLRWSRGLRDRLGMSHERSDQEIVDELERTGEVSAVVSRELFDLRLSRDHVSACRVLEAAERGDWRSVAEIVGGSPGSMVLPDGRGVPLFEATWVPERAVFAA